MKHTVLTTVVLGDDAKTLSRVENAYTGVITGYAVSEYTDGEEIQRRTYTEIEIAEVNFDATYPQVGIVTH